MKFAALHPFSMVNWPGRLAAVSPQPIHFTISVMPAGFGRGTVMQVTASRSFGHRRCRRSYRSAASFGLG